MPDFDNILTTANVLFRWSSFYWFVRERLSQTDFQSQKEIPAQRKSYGPQPPQVSQDVFRRNLASFAALAKSKGIEVMFGSQPLNPLDYPIGFLPTHRYQLSMILPAPGEFNSHHHRFNQIIQEVADTTSSYFVDQEADFPGNKAMFFDRVHYKVPGVQRLARNYYRAIVLNNHPNPPRFLQHRLGLTGLLIHHREIRLAIKTADDEAIDEAHQGLEQS